MQQKLKNYQKALAESTKIVATAMTTDLTNVKTSQQKIQLGGNTIIDKLIPQPGDDTEFPSARSH